MGAKDEKLEGEWIWVDGTKMTFNAWGQGNPDNVGGREHYLYALLDKGIWNDTEKDWDHHRTAPVVGYVCEWKVR